jgi:hypothetical protein
MNDYNKLTKAEKLELCDRIAQGEISRACSELDWINLKLSTGKICIGKYAHGSDDGAFIQLEVR